MSVYSTDMTNSQVPKKTETERKRFYLSAFDKLSAIYLLSAIYSLSVYFYEVIIRVGNRIINVFWNCRMDMF
jgi:hypothetical protein